jgi:hypothetical protein
MKVIRRSATAGESENSIQAKYFAWCSEMSVKHKVLKLAFHIPNGSHKSPAARGLFKAIGLKPGVPDVFLPVAAGAFHGLWIEFKSSKGRVSDTQKEWHDALLAQDYMVIVSRDWRHAADETLVYLGYEPLYRKTYEDTDRNATTKQGRADRGARRPARRTRKNG